MLHAAQTLPSRRIVPSARSVYDRIRDSGLAEEGRLVLISLRPIAETLGDRWSLRCLAVYSHVERGLERLLSPDAMFLRVSDTEYLIAQPSSDATTAQVFCLRFLQAVLRHYLGEFHDAAGMVLKVRALADDSMDASPVDMAMLSRALAPAAAQGPADPAGRVDAWSPFRAADGVETRVVTELREILNLRTYDLIGMRLERTVQSGGSTQAMSRAELSRLPRADLEAIDRIVLDQGLDLLSRRNQRPAVASVPLSLVTASQLRGRSYIFPKLRQAAGLVSVGIVACLNDLEDAPIDTMLATTSALRPYCIRLTANLREPNPSSIRAVQSGGFDAFSAERPSLPDEKAFVAWVKSLLWISRQFPLALVGVTQREAAVAATLGVGHVTLEGPAHRRTTPTLPSSQLAH